VVEGEARRCLPLYDDGVNPVLVQTSAPRKLVLCNDNVPGFG
jgi:hypothetical protein